MTINDRDFTLTQSGSLTVAYPAYAQLKIQITGNNPWLYSMQGRVNLLTTTATPVPPQAAAIEFYKTQQGPWVKHLNLSYRGRVYGIVQANGPMQVKLRRDKELVEQFTLNSSLPHSFDFDYADNDLYLEVMTTETVTWQLQLTDKQTSLPTTTTVRPTSKQDLVYGCYTSVTIKTNSQRYTVVQHSLAFTGHVCLQYDTVDSFKNYVVFIDDCAVASSQGYVSGTGEFCFDYNGGTLKVAITHKEKNISSYRLACRQQQATTTNIPTQTSTTPKPTTSTKLNGLTAINQIFACGYHQQVTNLHQPLFAAGVLRLRADASKDGKRLIVQDAVRTLIDTGLLIQQAIDVSFYYDGTPFRVTVQNQTYGQINYRLDHVINKVTTASPKSAFGLDLPVIQRSSTSLIRNHSLDLAEATELVIVYGVQANPRRLKLYLDDVLLLEKQITAMTDASCRFSYSGGLLRVELTSVKPTLLLYTLTKVKLPAVSPTTSTSTSTSTTVLTTTPNPRPMNTTLAPIITTTTTNAPTWVYGEQKVYIWYVLQSVHLHAVELATGSSISLVYSQSSVVREFLIYSDDKLILGQNVTPVPAPPQPITFSYPGGTLRIVVNLEKATVSFYRLTYS